MATATFENTGWAGATALPFGPPLDVRSHRVARPRRAFLAAELTLLAVVSLQAIWGVPDPRALILIASCALFFHVNHLDRSVVTAKPMQFCIDLIASVGLGFLASAWLFYLIPGLVPPVSAALMAGLLIGVLPVVLRLSLRGLIARGKFVEQILIVGTGDLPAKLHRVLVRAGGDSRRNPQALSVSDGLADRAAMVALTELKELVAKDRISRVVIADLDTQSRERLAAELLDSPLRGLQVNDAVEFYEELSGKIWVDALNAQWFVKANGFGCSAAGGSLKRCFDVLLALLVIMLGAPFLALLAIAVKLDSAGPVLFRQVRVGLRGKTFLIYKFRSMRQDAELETGPAWASECDPRVTGLGRLLRAFRLDELPQVFNVLIGDMSLVGPRPERPCFVSALEREIPFYNLRHYLKPGITGWAQVMFQYGASVGDSYEKLQYDFYYAKHRSLRFDIGIILKTVAIVLLGHGR